MALLETSPLATPKHPSTLAPVESSQRNISVILPSFTPYLAAPSTSKVLEISSGSGIHIAQFAAAFPGLNFQPTECDEYGLQEIDKTVERLKNVKKAILLDVTDKDRWNELEKEGPFDTVLGSNFLHMIPFPQGSDAIFRHLANPKLVNQHHGRFCVYGPFKSSGGFFSDSDKEFDDMIKARPEGDLLGLGLRELEALENLALNHGWVLREKILLPRGNFTLVWGPLPVSPPHST